ncbi:Transcription initiation factor IIA subunit 2 [Coemansia sp. RSA 1813]|nr:Transcription initiation factor IIA subunit 2 [Coemansia sp. RSA 1646]KAJ1772067.1 Transcription initiation factor IIA subunit 2 [Coemansia sp. RSA 1843]KAJ2090405.1 Transcription initiation factor IIA subunit 2 [Coemansia sp. RSA 986]KAJ2215371.1 Transcription initiation factor IIA subunit 2 [Coemansia sp. RSA 487]KAJ2569960.1 Transcription initiation factor IIA subunit 2 [Coemansia sp. RSA 1813]
MTSYYELYHTSTLGAALADSLGGLLITGRITPQLALQVMEQYKSILEVLLTKVKAKAVMKGNLRTYKFCDDVWTFIIDNPTFKVDHETVTAGRVKAVACNLKRPGE